MHMLDNILAVHVSKAKTLLSNPATMLFLATAKKTHYKLLDRQLGK